MPAKCPSFLELAHLVISLLCGNKPVSYSYKLVYQSTLLVGRVVAGSNPVTPTAEYQGVKQLA